MPTKTARILSYLPGTFRRDPHRSALYAIVDAFGNELLTAENSLAAVMLSHWVDHADRGESVIRDLQEIAAMYGLAPRPDESVEAFREHLKRYVRTFLEGTVTVQGVLRVTAEALGLHIADAYAELDSWWTRADDGLTTVQPRGDDAAAHVLGVSYALGTGRSAGPARVTGTEDLSDGVDLREGAFLRLEVDDVGPEEIDLLAGAADPARVSPQEIVARINAEMGITVAYHDGRHVVLVAPSRGPDSRIEVQYVAGDAAERVLGLPPRTYRGTAPQAATVTGRVDLSEGIDLEEDWYLRLTVDGFYVAEIDLGSVSPSHVTLDELCDRVNQALDVEVASHDGTFLTLTSPSAGLGSSILFERPAAQEATQRLFGEVPVSHIGRDAQPARFVSRRDLSDGVDLSERANVQLQIDGGATVTINCAGVNPAKTRLSEIVNAINDASGELVAHHDGRYITLTSPTPGPGGEIVVGYPPEEDATEDIFGVGPRMFEGTAPAAARILGERDLSQGVDLTARHTLKIVRDGGTPQEIDLRAGAHDVRAVTLNELRDAINAALEGPVATHDGERLILITPETGSARSLRVEPVIDVRRRRFVTRAIITDEAAPVIWGPLAREEQGAPVISGSLAHEARGKPATNARLVGKKDLRRGVDLSEKRYLRLKIDDHRAVDVDCAGRRPRVTTLAEVVARINAALRQVLTLKNKLDALGVKVADDDGRHVVLISPALGAKSRIAIETPRATDAVPVLLGFEPGTVRGRDATQVRFVGTVDLSGGIDLSAADRIKLGVDGAEPVEIACAGADPANTSLGEVVAHVKAALGQAVASQDGQHVILTSLKTGRESQLVFEAPDEKDATVAILGFAPPRTYHGEDGMAAQVVGQADLLDGANVEQRRFLRLAVDGAQVVVVDCVSHAAQPARATLTEIVEAINAAMEGDVASASDDGMHLVLTSPTSGGAGQLALEPHTDPEIDAREVLLGPVDPVTQGEDPAPAIITGSADLLAPVNLIQRRRVRLAVDGGRPEEIDVSGSDPGATRLDEIVADINDVFPDVASATGDDRLRLTSPTVGEESRLSLQPLRYLEVIEFPLEPTPPASQQVRHGDAWTVINDGAADVYVEARLTAPSGTCGPSLANLAEGWQVRLLQVLEPGDTARVWRDPARGLLAERESPDGQRQSIPGDRILVGPLGSQVWVPFEGEWTLCGGDGDQLDALQLNNPLAPGVVVLRARAAVVPGREIRVAVREHDFDTQRPDILTPDGASLTLIGRVRADGETFHLLDQDDAVVAELWPGPDMELELYENRVVTASGPFYPDDPPVLIAQRLVQRFDVALRFQPPEGEEIEELYQNVTIGDGTQGDDSLVWQINSGADFSELVRAQEWAKETVLHLPQGRSTWRYLDCLVPRFDAADFPPQEAAFHQETLFPGFPGTRCRDRGVFDVSRFARQDPPEPVIAVFGPPGPLSDPPIEVEFCWERHRPGAFVVNLPSDLPDRFGGRFNQARFGQGENAPEMFSEVITERTGDTEFDERHYVVELVNSGYQDEGAGIDVQRSTLVEASTATHKPQGWQPVEMPFREPQFLTLGTESAAAKIYLYDEQLENKGYILLQAREVGAWGNEIAVTVRPAGPAMYDLSVIYKGACLENARKMALLGHSQLEADEHLPALMADILKPGPIGVLQAKAAGVRAAISRDGVKQLSGAKPKENGKWKR